MKPGLSRVALVLAIVCCIGISIFSSVLNISHLAAAGLTDEIADAATGIERRTEIATGFNNATALQSRLATAIWWLALAAILLVMIVLFRGFHVPRSPSQRDDS